MANVFDELVSVVKKQFNDVKADKGDLLTGIAKSLIGEAVGNVSSQDNIVNALIKLVISGDLKLPDLKIGAGAVPPDVLNLAKNVMKTVLTASGNPGIAIATDKAVNILMRLCHSCGATREALPSASPAPAFLKEENGTPAIQYFIEEISDNVPNLPSISKGPGFPHSPKVARSQLQKAFESWSGQLNLFVEEAVKQDDAHLLISARPMDGMGNVLAVTQIGPSGGQQLTMVFDSDETDLTPELFRACACHEFGHFLGISHSEVPGTGALMSPFMDDNILEPTPADLLAAHNHGW